MLLHALIIDDEENGIVTLDLMIKKYVPEIKVVAKTTSPEEGVELINQLRPDIVFLDINMPGMNGFQLLEKVSFQRFHLIFTTAYEEYALKAIKKNALDYLLKPVDGDDLKRAVKKVIEKASSVSDYQNALNLLKNLREQREIKISIPVKDGIRVVNAEEIIYIEANSNHAIVLLSDKSKHEVNKSLKEFEMQLCDGSARFIRLHNSFVINVNHVTRYLPEDGGYAVLADEKTIPISKTKKDEFLGMINFGVR